MNSLHKYQYYIPFPTRTSFLGKNTAVIIPLLDPLFIYMFVYRMLDLFTCSTCLFACGIRLFMFMGNISAGN